MAKARAGKRTRCEVVLAGTQMDEAGVAQLKKLRKLAGAGVCNDSRLGTCTHLVHGGTLQRSVKSLFAAARGIPTISLSSVSQYLQKGSFDPPKHPGNLHTFKGLSFAIPEGAKTSPGVNTLTALIELHGGTVRADSKSDKGKAEDAGEPIVVVKGSEENGSCPQQVVVGGRYVTDEAIKESLFKGVGLVVKTKPQPEPQAPHAQAQPPAQQPRKVGNVSLADRPPPPPSVAANSQLSGTSPMSVDLLPHSKVAAEPKPPYLTLEVPNSSGTVPAKIVLEKDETTVGRTSRSVEVDVRIDSEEVRNMISRKHAVFHRQVDDLAKTWVVTLEDLGSTNGFFVNGVKRKKWVLAHGDIVTLGGGGGEEIAEATRVDDIISDCVYRYHCPPGSIG